MFLGDANLFRPPEIYHIISAIHAMVFRLQRDKHKVFLQFEGRFCFVIDQQAKTLSMIDNTQQTFTQVYQFRWWRIGDALMRWKLGRALAFHDRVMHKVKMNSYRAMFGSLMEEVITDLGKLMTAAEAESAMLDKMDKTQGGSNYHPEIQRLLQMGAPPPPADEPKDQV